jgi:phosphofructokinase-like protein
MKKLLVLTGGGDCPGLNAVIRGISKAAHQNGNWEAWGSVEAFNGLLKSPIELIKLTKKKVAGIHVKGGTILKTTNQGNPLEYPIQLADGSWSTEDKTQELVDIIQKNGFDAVINIGGDGSQKISQALFENGLNILGVPKTIDNDLSATDLTFGFSTAVQIATECFDKLVTTAESHHRVMIMEVMGRDAGWIALYSAIAGGAEICLIPEIPFDLEVILRKIESRYDHGKGFVNIVVAEGAKMKEGKVVEKSASAFGDKHLKLGGIANHLRAMLEEANCSPQIRTTVLGHIQRGGTPISFDRILASSMGVRAFEMARDGEFGKMVAYKNNQLEIVPILEAVKDYNFIKKDHYLINTARSLGISFGNE